MALPSVTADPTPDQLTCEHFEETIERRKGVSFSWCHKCGLVWVGLPPREPQPFVNDAVNPSFELWGTGNIFAWTDCCPQVSLTTNEDIRSTQWSKHGLYSAYGDWPIIPATNPGENLVLGYNNPGPNRPDIQLSRPGSWYYFAIDYNVLRADDIDYMDLVWDVYADASWDDYVGGSYHDRSGPQAFWPDPDHLHNEVGIGRLEHWFNLGLAPWSNGRYLDIYMPIHSAAGGHWTGFFDNLIVSPVDGPGVAVA